MSRPFFLGKKPQYSSIQECVDDNTTVSETGCKLWNKKTDPNGYAIRSWKGKLIKVHRAVFFEFNSGLQADSRECKSLQIRHSCHQRNCVNVNHLSLGTAKENAADKKHGGAHFLGQSHPGSKITEATARLIIESFFPKNHSSHTTRIARAKKYNVSYSSVNAIDRGSSWAYLPRNKHFDKCKNLAIVAANQRRCKAKIYSLEHTTYAYNKIMKQCKENSSKPGYAGTKCLEWQGRQVFGRSRVTVYQKTQPGHVFICEYKENRLKPDGLQTLHKCGNCLCHNKLHLKFDTIKANFADTIVHGHPSFKLDADKVETIRKLYKEKDLNKSTISGLARTYKVNRKTISDVVHNRRWKFV